LLGKASRLTHPVSRTAAKVLAFAVDLFTAVICTPFALLYNCSIAPIANTIIKIANRKTIKASKSWKPTSYKAIAIDLALVASVATLGVLGYKHFFQASTSHTPSTIPEITNWKETAMKIGTTTKDGTVNFLKTCFWGNGWSQRVPKLMFGGFVLYGIFGKGKAEGYPLAFMEKVSELSIALADRTSEVHEILSKKNIYKYATIASPLLLLLLLGRNTTRAVVTAAEAAGALGAKIGGTIGTRTGATFGIATEVTAVALALAGINKLVSRGREGAYGGIPGKLRIFSYLGYASIVLYGSMSTFGAMKGLGGAIGPTVGSLSGQLITAHLAATAAATLVTVAGSIFENSGKTGRILGRLGAVGAAVGLVGATAFRMVTLGDGEIAPRALLAGGVALGALAGIQTVTGMREIKIIQALINRLPIPNSPATTRWTACLLRSYFLPLWKLQISIATISSPESPAAHVS
jgi:hypothetical protein